MPNEMGINMSKKTRIAAANMAVDPRDIEDNISKMEKLIDRASESSIDLIVFPEQSVTGYGTKGMTLFSAEDKLFFQQHAEPIPDGPTVKRFIRKAKEKELYICFGMTELDEERFNVTYNTVVLVGPEGYVGKTRKVHLPLCERLIHMPGSEYPVFETAIGKIGIEVCFDKCFPEVARSLALKGAEIILGPTAWPNITKSEDDPDHKASLVFSQARALENMVVFVESNQCGDPYGGFSRVLGPNPGQILAQAGFEEELAIAELDVRAEINHARMVSMGGSDLLRDRMPFTYGALAEESPYGIYCRS